MRKYLLIIGVVLIGLSSCHSDKNEGTLLSRTFPTQSWERFDFVKAEIDLKKPGRDAQGRPQASAHQTEYGVYRIPRRRKKLRRLRGGGTRLFPR